MCLQRAHPPISDLSQPTTAIGSAASASLRQTCGGRVATVEQDIMSNHLNRHRMDPQGMDPQEDRFDLAGVPGGARLPIAAGPHMLEI
jgi:hypothetical protein